MSSQLRKEKLGALSESSGTITLGPSILNIGGRQYSTASLNVAVGSHGLNALRYIYAVQSAGVVSLQISDAPNSVGPGTDSWKLVGALYTDGVSGDFGSFVNIEGVPTSRKIAYTPFTQGFGTITDVGFFWQRRGDLMVFQCKFESGTTTGDQAQLGLPGSFEFDADSVHSGFNNANVAGVGALSANGEIYTLLIDRTDRGVLKIGRAGASAAGLNYFLGNQLMSAAQNVSFNATGSISGWSNTPLKDL